ncbi:hypothetical protein BCV71DRAFT_186401, partial [Rhizopus microsporus]
VDELTKSFEGFDSRETVVGKFTSNVCNVSTNKVNHHPIARNQRSMIIEKHRQVETWFKKTKMDYTKDCISIDESVFDISVKPPAAKHDGIKLRTLTEDMIKRG